MPVELMLTFPRAVVFCSAIAIVTRLRVSLEFKDQVRGPVLEIWPVVGVGIPRSLGGLTHIGEVFLGQAFPW